MTALRKTRKKLSLVIGKACRPSFWRRAPFRLRIRYLNPERPRRFPNRVQIEATSKCNLRCPCCSHSRESSGGQHLDMETLQEVLRRLSPAPRRVILSGIGEPLLNPSFFAMVDLLAERGIRCEFYTNGTMLTSPAQEAILSRASIDTVNISCDGAGKATFESLRLGADFERWKQFVGRFLAEVRQRRRRTLSVSANVVLCRENLTEIGDILRLVAGLGFGGVYIMQPIPVDETAAALCASPAEFATVSEEELVRLARSLGLKIACSFQRPRSLGNTLPRCTQPWEHVFIRANGDVAPCCALFGSERSEVMGNLLAEDFAAVWQGERFRRFRRSSTEGTNALCRVCPYH